MPLGDNANVWPGFIFCYLKSLLCLNFSFAFLISFFFQEVSTVTTTVVKSMSNAIHIKENYLHIPLY